MRKAEATANAYVAPVAGSGLSAFNMHLLRVELPLVANKTQDTQANVTFRYTMNNL